VEVKNSLPNQISTLKHHLDVQSVKIEQKHENMICKSAYQQKLFKKSSNPNGELRPTANAPLAIRKAMHLFISVFNIYFDNVLSFF